MFRAVPSSSKTSWQILIPSLILISGFCANSALANPESLDFRAYRTFGEPGLAIRFELQYGTSDVENYSCVWDFGDGTTSNDPYPEHVYNEAGCYTVSLTLITPGGPLSRIKQDYVHIGKPRGGEKSILDLHQATIVYSGGTLPKAEAKARTVLVEEVEKRTNIRLPESTTWPSSGPVIALTVQAGIGDLGAEGYHLFTDTSASGRPVVWIVGVDGRGVLYGVGRFLREMLWETGFLQLPAPLDIATSPAFPLRGHQLGYRNTANSYDAWTVDQYEQYIRELVIFGCNAIENIPFEPEGNSPHFQLPPSQMAQELSRICDEYDIQYWVWTPADFDLTNTAAHNAALVQHEQLYAGCTRLDGVFVPGGDPGDNPPEQVMVFLEELATRLAAHHPNAGVWVSNQGFTEEENDWFFTYLQNQHPSWLAGVVYGPWTRLTLEEERTRTPSQYRIRRYPDITHNVRCQYPVPEWDAAFAHTLGREASNPRPTQTAHIHNVFARFADGFITYSDGIHDDVNKVVWCVQGWDPDSNVEETLKQYGRFFFGPSVADGAATGILQLESNWSGPLADNPVVANTFAHWQTLESAHPELATNWRWQLCLLRAYYDFYTRERLHYETEQEAQAKTILANASSTGAETAMRNAEAVLALADTAPIRRDLQDRIQDLCTDLYSSIGLQTSTAPPFNASGLERGCVLDTLNWPLNDRCWLQIRFSAIRSLGNETDKLHAINELLNWENPGEGGFYDDLGALHKQPHVIQPRDWAVDPGRLRSVQNEVSWHNGDRQNLKRGGGRLSWQNQAQTLYGTPLQMHYAGLQAEKQYKLRVVYTGRFAATMRLKANGTYTIHSDLPQPATPTVLEYLLPLDVTAGGTLDLQWDLVSGRGCQVAEVWLVPQEPFRGPATVQASDGEFADRIRITYSPVEGAVSYWIYRAETPNINSAILIATWNQTSLDDFSIEDPLPPAWGCAGPNGSPQVRLYYYWVSAYNGTEESLRSGPDCGYAAPKR